MRLYEAYTRIKLYLPSTTYFMGVQERELVVPFTFLLVKWTLYQLSYRGGRIGAV